MDSLSINLTTEELVEITGKIRHSAQFRVLSQMGIPVKKRSDGIPVVCRHTYMRHMGAFEPTKNSNLNDTPDFSSFRM